MLIIVYVALVLFCLVGIKPHSNGYIDDYLSKSRCNAVKGFFILLVFISHVNQYITSSGYMHEQFGDKFYFRFVSSIGQLMVVMFLFFSGYGIMESFMKKREAYVATMPRKRIITTLLNFDIAVLCFIVLNLLLGKSLSIKQVFLSFLAWDSVGNSNWYIFCILVCYLLSYVSLHLYNKYFNSKSIYIYALSPIFILSIAAIIVLSYFKAPYWYNTMLCFPFGMFFSIVKEKVDTIVQQHYYISIAACIVLFLALRYIPVSMKGLFFNMESIAFAMIIILLMMKVESNNKWLCWMGKNLFPMYIYQRLAMMAIYEMPEGKDIIASFPLLYIFICFICTLLITSHYYRWQIKLS